jgi:hypothetical protein
MPYLFKRKKGDFMSLQKQIKKNQYAQQYVQLKTRALQLVTHVEQMRNDVNKLIAQAEIDLAAGLLDQTDLDDLQVAGEIANAQQVSDFIAFIKTSIPQ